MVVIGEILLVKAIFGLDMPAADGGGKAKLGVVRLTGAMTAESPAGAAHIIPALKVAFGNHDVKEIALFIDSPGGAPAEAERIGAFLDQQRKATGKPVVAIISNIGASAAYLTALHTDRIVAGRYSLVGSIGAVVQGWELERVLEKFDVKQRSFASGKFKTMLNPFQAMTPETADKVQAMADRAGSIFANEVRQLRGEKLKLAEFNTGEVWDGESAKKHGLIDELGTLDVYAASKNLVVLDMGPATSKSLPFLKTVADGLADALIARSTLRLE
jgi:protease-4